MDLLTTIALGVSAGRFSIFDSDEVKELRALRADIARMSGNPLPPPTPPPAPVTVAVAAKPLSGEEIAKGLLGLLAVAFIISVFTTDWVLSLALWLF